MVVKAASMPHPLDRRAQSKIFAVAFERGLKGGGTAVTQLTAVMQLG
jgi:hypothetical protein